MTPILVIHTKQGLRKFLSSSHPVDDCVVTRALAESMLPYTVTELKRFFTYSEDYRKDLMDLDTFLKLFREAYPQTQEIPIQ